jgi:Putative beta barrel porin-7 (BBP7)
MIGARDNWPNLALILLATCALAYTPAAAAQEDGLGDFAGEMDYAPLWRVRGEYLYWWSNGNPTPPLVTTSPAGTPRAQAGVLGTPGVEVLWGDRAMDTEARSGGRVTISRWLEDDDETVVEFVGFFVGNDYQSGDFVRESAGAPILSRPFLNVTSNLEDAELVAFPGVLAGRVAVRSYSEAYSAAALLRQNYSYVPSGRIDVIGGYRYFHWREELTIQENLVSIDPGGVIPLNTTTDLNDRFATGNDFHGAEFGLAAEYFWPTVSVELLAKVAIGGTFRSAAVGGATTVTIPGNPPQTTAGGLLALPTNLGSYSESAFGVLPELGLNMTFALTPDVSLLTGYSLIVFNDVLRTGRQIDRAVNTSQIGGDPLIGPARPAFAFDHSNLVLQGFNVGLEYRW